MHVFLNSERRHQSVALNSLATFWLLWIKLGGHGMGNITNTTIHLTRMLEQEINYVILNHVPSI